MTRESPNRVTPLSAASRAFLTCSTLLAALASCAREQEAQPETDTSATESITDISVGGFSTPESVLHDKAADLYLVSNINGAPAAKDNNGFISRLSPDGTIVDARWIAGGTGGVVLHAPKGMAIRGDSLFVADLDTIRIFNRATGAAVGAWGIPGVTFLNDLAIGPDGNLYVSDTGMRASAAGELEPTGTDAIYRISPAGQAQPIASGADLKNPNGLTVTSEGLVMVPFGGAEMFRFDASGQRSTIATLPAGQLDGVEQLQSGGFIVTSWEGQSVYRVSPTGEVTVELPNVEAPADAGYDASRNRMLLPRFNANRVEIMQLQ